MLSLKGFNWNLLKAAGIDSLYIGLIILLGAVVGLFASFFLHVGALIMLFVGYQLANSQPYSKVFFFTIGLGLGGFPIWVSSPLLGGVYMTLAAPVCLTLGYALKRCFLSMFRPPF